MPFWPLTTLTASLYAGDAKKSLASDAGLRQAVERAVYSLKDSGDGSYRGVNPKQRLQVEFDQRATRLQHAQGNVSLRLSGYGYGERLRTPAEAKPAGTPQGVEYRRGELTEWYKNQSSGLEQGFTLEQRPGTARQGEPLIISLAVEGDLLPALASTGDAVLLESSGQTILRYDGLRSWDARGRAVAGRMEVRERQVRLVIEDQNAEYPLVVDPTWTQQQKLFASDGVFRDEFGYSVSVDGDTAVIGAINRTTVGNANGAAYVFVRSGTSWTQQAELLASDAAANDNFGWSVSVSGDTVVVGAPYHEVTDVGQGAAYVFVRSGITWTQQQELLASDEAANDNLGWSVSVDGDTAVVGAPDKTVGSNSEQGVAYVFVRSGTTWTQQQQLTASDGVANDDFGYSVSVNGDTAVIGDLQRNAAYVFVRSGTTWTQQQELTTSDGVHLSSVAVNGNIAVIGSPGTTVGTNSAQGSAYVFVRSGTTWTLQQELFASDGAMNNNFGWSVAISSGDTVVVGAPGASGVSEDGDTGAAYVFVQPPPAPDLTATKSDNVGGVTPYPNGWTWTITVANANSAGPATFGIGATILTDTLPAGSTVASSPAL